MFTSYLPFQYNHEYCHHYGFLVPYGWSKVSLSLNIILKLYFLLLSVKITLETNILLSYWKLLIFKIYI